MVLSHTCKSPIPFALMQPNTITDKIRMKVSMVAFVFRTENSMCIPHYLCTEQMWV